MRSSLAQDDVICTWLRNMIFVGNELGNIFSNRVNAQGRRVASSATDFLEDDLGPLPGISIDGLILNEIGADNTRENFSWESQGLLVELVRVSDAAVGDFIEWII